MIDPVILIYILIGLAHTAAHVLGCVKCRGLVEKNMSFALEAVVMTLGWPLQLLEYIRDMLRSPKKEAPGNPGDFKIVEVTMEPGDTLATFKERVENAIKENLNKKDESK